MGNKPSSISIWRNCITTAQGMAVARAWVPCGQASSAINLDFYACPRGIWATPKALRACAPFAAKHHR